MRNRALAGICCVLTLLLSGELGAEADLLKGAKPLAAGEKLEVTFDLPKARPVTLRVTLEDADFGGATILTRVNDHAMLPYHAFGGDTRYDSVRGKPGMHPPVAKIQANYVLVTEWVKQGKNAVVVTNSGPGTATIESVTVEVAGGHNLPNYENSIFFEFDVWRQASVMKPIDWPDKRPEVGGYFDSMLLGILPGGGTHVMNYGGGDGAALKLAAEDARVNWGFGRSCFYSIWQLANNAKQWAEFVDVDKRPEGTPIPPAPANATKEQKEQAESAGKIHTQFANPPEVAPGTDITLIKPDGYLNALKPGIDGLLAFSSEYNFTCEQWGPRGSGFGRWFGNHFAAQGYDGKKWADNYQTEFGKLAGYVHKLNPGATVYSPHWWLPDIRFVMYDTSLARGFKMSDMTDGFMTHYYSFTHAGYRKDGTPFVDDDKNAPQGAQPELQYPGGKFESPDWEKSRAYMGTWPLIPEIAIDWNRYRLSRTEKDMKLGDPKVNRWVDGKPFNYAAGFDGDERLYNNETCVYDRAYSAPAPYQFLYAMFSYSLLPSGGSEPKDFKFTRMLPLEPVAPASEDIFSTVDVPINKYGDFVAGAAHTHRLKTKDPLYDDLFGYTGFEQATTGDYIWLSGIKDRNHRKPGANAWNLVRKTCYAFVTKAPVYPSIVNDADTNNLFVKTLLVSQGGQPVIGVYAVNFDSKPHVLDVTLPAPWQAATVPAQVFDENAADWVDAKEQMLPIKARQVRHNVTIPAGAPWAMFIYPPPEHATMALGSVTIPQPTMPWGNQDVGDAQPELKWRLSGNPGDISPGQPTYEVQLASEKLFRPQDVVMTTPGVKSFSTKVTTKLEANRRYHWRVRAITSDGQSSAWSPIQSFWFRAATPPPALPSSEAPALAMQIPRPAKMPIDVAEFTGADNLARAMTTTVFSNPNYWEGASEAVDGNAASAWIPDNLHGEEGRATAFPAWWAARFDKDMAVKQLTVLWTEGKPAKDFIVQSWDGKAWVNQKSITDNKDAKSKIALDAPVTTRAVRIFISAAVADTTGIAEILIR